MDVYQAQRGFDPINETNKVAAELCYFIDIMFTGFSERIENLEASSSPNPKKLGWISIEDEMPRSNIHVITYNPLREKDEAVKVQWVFLAVTRHRIGTKHTWYGVTHWQPLPEPPND